MNHPQINFPNTSLCNLHVSSLTYHSNVTKKKSGLRDVVFLSRWYSNKLTLDTNARPSAPNCMWTFIHFCQGGSARWSCTTPLLGPMELCWGICGQTHRQSRSTGDYDTLPWIRRGGYVQAGYFSSLCYCFLSRHELWGKNFPGNIDASGLTIQLVSW